MSLVRHFAKSDGGVAAAIKAKGLGIAFQQFCRDVSVGPGEILDRGFKFRGLGRSKIQKLSARIEIELKEKGTPSSAAINKSPENLPSPQAIGDIQKVSDTLSYKQVHYFCTSDADHNSLNNIATIVLPWIDQGVSTTNQKSRGVFPIHHLKSQIASESGVSVERYHFACLASAIACHP